MRRPFLEKSPVVDEVLDRTLLTGDADRERAGYPDTPVLRVAKDGEVLGANEAALPLLAHWNLLIGDRLPGRWIGVVDLVLRSGEKERIGILTGTKACSLMFTPVGDGEGVTISLQEAAGSRGAGELCSMGSGVATFEARDDGRYFVVTSLNPAAGRAGGTSPGAEFPGFVDTLRRVWRTGSPEQIPMRCSRAGQPVVWGEIYVNRLPSGYLVAVFDDRTAQKRIETSLIESEEKFRGITQRSFDMIFTADPAGVITYASPAVHRILGCEPAAITGRRCREYIARHNRSAFSRATGQLLAGKDVEGLILECVRDDGSPVFVEINASPIVRNGVVTGIQGVGRDVTERIAAEDLKKQAYDQIDRNIEQFAILGDHIRQPLQVILGIADIIGDEKSEILAQQVRRINNIIRQLDQGWIESRKVQEFLRRCG